MTILFGSVIEDSSECGVEEVGGGGLGGGEPGFQRVAPAHLLVHLRHDPPLFGERRKWKYRLVDLFGAEVGNCAARRDSQVLLNLCRQIIRRELRLDNHKFYSPDTLLQKERLVSSVEAEFARGGAGHRKG